MIIAYLIENYWVWSLLSLICGGVVAHWWLPQPYRGIFARWAFAVFFFGLVAARLQLLPGRLGLYLDTLLFLLLSSMVGGLIGGWLRRSPSELEPIGGERRSSEMAPAAGPPSHVQVKEVESVASFATAGEAASPVEAKAAEEPRTVALKAEEDARREAEAIAAEAAGQAAAVKAAEEARLAAEAKAAEEAGRAAALKEEAEAQRAAEAKAAAEAGQAAAADAYPGLMPSGIAAPRNGRADDLKLIKGIGPKNEGVCNDLGVYHLDQIADWTADEAIWVGHRLAFPGRVEREHWIDQARLLVAGGDTEHSAGVKTGTILVDAAADNPLGGDEAAALRASLPEQAAALEDGAKYEGRRPYGLKAPLQNKADDLQRIRGIGPRNESRLHALGIWHFDQIAGWTRENVLWVGSYLAFPGRIDREKWIAQAKDLSAGRDSGFRK